MLLAAAGVVLLLSALLGGPTAPVVDLAATPSPSPSTLPAPTSSSTTTTTTPSTTTPTTASTTTLTTTVVPTTRRERAKVPGDEPSACVRRDVHGVGAVAVSPSGRLWATIDNSIGVSDDDGRTWHWGCNRAPYFASQIFAVSDDAAWALGTLPAFVVERTPEIGLVHTADAGRTWSSAKLPFSGVSDAAFVDATHGWAAGSAADGSPRLARTVDGTSWHSLPPPATEPGAVAGALSFSDHDHGWLAAGGRLHVTDDGGESWTAVPFVEQVWVSDLVALRKDHAVVSAASLRHHDGSPPPPEAAAGIYTTDDRGRTWTRRLPGVIAVCCNTSMDVLGPNAFAFTDGDQVHTTPDGGTTWSTMAVHESWSLHSLVARPPNTLLVSSVGEGEVLRSDDRGRTWRTVRLPYVENQP